MADCLNIGACNAIVDHLKNILLHVEQIASEVAIYQQYDRESHVLLNKTFLWFKTCLNAIPVDKWGKYELPYFYTDAIHRSFQNHGYVFIPSMPEPRETPLGKTLFPAISVSNEKFNKAAFFDERAFSKCLYNGGLLS